MKEVFAYRLKSARKMKGFSMQSLADELGVSRNMISKYETGKSLPDSARLIELANILGVKSGFFFRPFSIELEKVDFRKKTALSKKEEQSINEKSKDFLERYIEVEEHLGIYQEFENPILKIEINSIEDIEHAVLELRKKWQLGLNPLSNIFEMLENKGFKIFEVKASKSFDGLSSIIANNIPILVINEMSDILRRRFTILHELGHILLQIPENCSYKQIENYCNYFAGSFLIPKQVLIAELGIKRHSVILKELIDIKEYYGISLQALMYRARNLEIISEQSARRFWQFIRSSADKQKEIGLGEYKGKEKSDRFNQLLYRAYAEEIISKSKVAELLNTTLLDLKQNLQLI